VPESGTGWIARGEAALSGGATASRCRGRSRAARIGARPATVTPKSFARAPPAATSAGFRSSPEEERDERDAGQQPAAQRAKGRSVRPGARGAPTNARAARWSRSSRRGGSIEGAAVLHRGSTGRSGGSATSDLEAVDVAQP
jgi:hypothetical protein